MKKKGINYECDSRGHDLYLGEDKNTGKLIYKCMYCSYTKPVFKKIKT
jgi:hypothetical protein